jgi:HAD superfamily hydrolase (TIGR01490 family)
MRTAAFFDLDGTLLAANTANLWAARERRHGRLALAGLARVAFYMACYRLGVLDIEAALRSALAGLRGVQEEHIRAESRVWWAEDVRHHVAPGARPVLEAHRARGDLLVLLTSSSRYASEQAREEFGLDEVLFQQYEVRDGCFTGEPLQPFCYGPGKVHVAEAFAREAGIDLSRSAFYSDSATDVPMLERVGQPVVVNPEARLRRIARTRGWPVADWRGAQDR